MPRRPPPRGKPAASNKAARALQRAISKDNLAKEPPIVGKPVIVDPPEAALSSRRKTREARRNDGKA